MECTEDQFHEWLEDLDELLLMPLTVTHPLAFAAPEVIREKAWAIITHEDQPPPN